MKSEVLTSPSTEIRGRLSELFCSCQGEGPHVGRRHVFVRLAGCTVGCRFCDTPDSLRPGEGFVLKGQAADTRHFANPIEAEAAAALILDLVDANRPVHAVSITGGEPLEQPAFLGELLPRLRGVVRLLETAGTLPDELARVIDEVDIVSMDLKLPSVARVRDCFDAHRRFLDIARRSDVYVKVVVNDRVSPVDWQRAVGIVAEVDAAIPFIVQPETDRSGALRADFARLQEFARLATAAGLLDVRVIPQVHKFLDAP